MNILFDYVIANKHDFWKRKAGRFTESECTTSRQNSDIEQDDGSTSDEITDKKTKNGLLETMQDLSDHSSSNDEVREQNITDSNTSSNDEQHDVTSGSSDEDKDILDDSSMNRSVLLRIEKKLKEINRLELKQMNGDELEDEEMIKVNRKHALTQKLHQLQQEANFAVNGWQGA